jgi:adenylyl-sulfate kinase
MKREDYEDLNSHKALCVWFTGLSGAGKTTIAKELEEILFNEVVEVVRLDGDILRKGVCKDLGFSPEDRKENIERAGYLAKLLFDYGHVVLCSFISPYEEDRQYVKDLFPEDKFILVHVKCDIEECKKRDPKGLYKRVKNGEIENFTGISAPYEEPEVPDIMLNTSSLSIKDSVDLVYNYIEKLID